MGLFRSILTTLAIAALPGCGAGGDATVPGDSGDMRPFADIAEQELLRFTGTEPFWGGEARDTTLVWKTPDQPLGREIKVERFAGRGGLSFSGRMEDQAFDMTITPGECSDGMSDRLYPYVATVRIGQEDYSGCAWSDRKGWSGPEAP